ncbi:MAG TPA: anthranilate phosphoribosyltransferase [Fimbriimonadaceae bacterium]|nr:anthranilate phosphoribosyltransferase [Fimbriimonadaceae bacterium]HRJ33936.1 anthranilate phosphoribosyltransferase [Fimbriimonadaceae bacterium]
MNFLNAIESVLSGQSLTQRDARSAMACLTDGSWTDVQAASFLTALRMKGASGAELAGMATLLRERAVSFGDAARDLVDTCGTGGGIPSFNLSTAAAFVAAGAGARIAKHGNRAVTSKCGSSDVLEALGLDLSADPEKLPHLLESVGLVFMFAPNHHPALARLGPIRRELGFRTVMNQLGPLANPAGAARQLIGVYDPALLDPMAEALVLLGVEQAAVVYAEIGLDEVSPCGPTFARVVRQGGIEAHTWTPADFGAEPLPVEALAPGSDPVENAALLREALTQPHSLPALAVIPNAACAIWVAGLAGTLAEAAALARNSIASGAAWHKLEALLTAQAAA